MGRPMLKLCLSLIKTHILIYDLTQLNHIMTRLSYLFSKFSLKKSFKNINHTYINAN